MGYAAGYGLATMLWVQLFYVCEMGERTDVNFFTKYFHYSIVL